MRVVSRDHASSPRLVVYLRLLRLFMADFGGNWRISMQKDWNETSPAHIAEHGRDSSPWHAYAASKVLAERAARKFVEDPNVKFDFVSIHPCYVRIFSPDRFSSYVL